MRELSSSLQKLCGMCISVISLDVGLSHFRFAIHVAYKQIKNFSLEFRLVRTKYNVEIESEWLVLRNVGQSIIAYPYLRPSCGRTFVIFQLASRARTFSSPRLNVFAFARIFAMRATHL